ncbi:MAG TPA: phage holin family protein [Caulobacteraceae bacterium]|jgi:hypothetical protein|nr:phage holin family protein [Caulobacteraceae bacterium]
MTDDPRTIPELLSALTSELANLVRKESELVRTEVSEKVDQALHAGARMGIGAALLLGAFQVILAALVLALSKVMDPLWASIIVAIVVGAAGFVLIRTATSQIKPANLAPERSQRQLQKDAQLVKEQVE